MRSAEDSRVAIAEHIVLLEASLARAVAEREVSRADGRYEHIRESEVRVDLLKLQLDLRRRQRMP